MNGRYEAPSAFITRLTCLDVITTSGAYDPPASDGDNNGSDGTVGGENDLPWDN